MVFRNRVTTAILLQTQPPDLWKGGREEKQDVLKEKAKLVRSSGTSFGKEMSHTVCNSLMSLEQEMNNCCPPWASVHDAQGTQWHCRILEPCIWGRALPLECWANWWLTVSFVFTTCQVWRMPLGVFCLLLQGLLLNNISVKWCYC